MAQLQPDAEAPLLAACSKPDDDAALPPAKRNMYPFFCAVLASMTSVLMGYSTCRYILLLDLSFFLFLF